MTFDEIYTTVSQLASQGGSVFAGTEDMCADLHITGAGGGTIGASIKNGVLSVRSGSVGSPEASVSVSADDFSALISGRLNPMMAMMTGRVRVSGNYAKLMSLIKGFRGL